ncbi:MAG: aldo/keto reductase [Thermoplasmata archaeon]|nr:aldo/keto reductase [Thermoplasmata archaeon]
MIPGRGTPDATLALRKRAEKAETVSLDHYRRAPGDLQLASLGLGTYLGKPDAQTDWAVEEAVSVCLSSRRVNVIDTAINYRYQRAERSVGRAVAKAIDSGRVERTAIFIATKNGYLAPDSESPLSASEWIQRELVEPGIVRPAEIIDGNVMGIPFLTDQFERSRRNLGMETVDLLYLHNATESQLPKLGRAKFGEGLREVFTLYEGFRRAGKIGAYGLATWDALRAPRSDPGHWSLEESVQIAREVGGADHGFRFIQFPFNTSFPEAAVLRNQMVARERVTLFDAAERLGVGCFTNIPLLQGQLAREGPQVDGMTPAETALQLARSAPATIGPLVGQKEPTHLAENLAVCARPRWDAARFIQALA